MSVPLIELVVSISNCSNSGAEISTLTTGQEMIYNSRIDIYGLGWCAHAICSLCHNSHKENILGTDRSKQMLATKRAANMVNETCLQKNTQ